MTNNRALPKASKKKIPESIDTLEKKEKSLERDASKYRRRQFKICVMTKNLLQKFVTLQKNTFNSRHSQILTLVTTIISCIYMTSHLLSPKLLLIRRINSPSNWRYFISAAYQSKSRPLLVTLGDLKYTTDGEAYVIRDRSVVIPPVPISRRRLRQKMLKKDYGGLDLDLISHFEQGRLIRTNHVLNEGHIFTKEDYADDYRRDNYYAFDDDSVSRHRKKECRSVSWQLMHHPTCNEFHQVSLLDFEYLSRGYYRQVFYRDRHTHKTYFTNPLNIKDKVVLKSLRYRHDLDYQTFDYIRMDALVMERLTSSPRIVDIYGHCSASVLTEAFYSDITKRIIPEEDDGTNDDYSPRNDFTPEGKLQIALDMARSLADLHGFKDGVIVHNDVQLSQWVVNKDWSVMKLNDFNRARFMSYSTKNRVYCRYRTGGVYGTYRSPEESLNRPLNEKIDVFSFGNNIYALLIGVWNFHGIDDDEAVQTKLTEGELPYIDERYRNGTFSERALVKIMERCWVFDPDKRADIFEVVKFLSNAHEKNKRLAAAKNKKLGI